MRFDPRSLRYDVSGVPYLRPQQIENVAYEILSEYAPRTLHLPEPIPVADILDGLSLGTRLRVAWADLGSKGGSKILCNVSFPEETLCLDAHLGDERQPWFRFTAAHAAGHWLLHRHNWSSLRLEDGARFTGEFSDNEKSLGKLEPRSPREWLEFQANVFAACLAMPAGPFQKAVLAAQMRIDFNRQLEPDCPADADFDTTDFLELTSVLAGNFGVSRASVELRLKTMLLMIEEIDKPESVIGQIASKAAHTFVPLPPRSKP